MATWILVADQSRARLFKAQKKDGELEELADFVNPEGRMHGSELTRGPLPSSQESVGGARHGIEPRTTLDDKVATEFARDIAGLLEHGRVNHDYENLVLMAEPHFLGILRNSLGREVSKLVVQSVDKSLGRSTPEEIHRYLNKH